MFPSQRNDKCLGWTTKNILSRSLHNIYVLKYTIPYKYAYYFGGRVLLCSLAWTPQQSSGLNLPCAGITGMHYHTQSIHTHFYSMFYIYPLKYML